MKKWIPIFFIFSNLIVNAQIDSLSFNETKNIPHPVKINYKIPLLTWLDFTSPSVNFGVEIKFSKRFSLHQEVGYIDYRINKLFYDLEPRKVQGFKINIEPRFYVHRSTNKGVFLTPSIYYKYDNQFIKDGRFLRYNGQYTQLYDYSKIRNLIGITPKFGFQFLKENKTVGFEVSSGIGIRILNVAHSKNNIPEDAILLNRSSDIFIIRKDEGSFFRPNFFVGLSLIFRDKNNR